MAGYLPACALLAGFRCGASAPGRETGNGMSAAGKGEMRRPIRTPVDYQSGQTLPLQSAICKHHDRGKMLNSCTPYRRRYNHKGTAQSLTMEVTKTPQLCMYPFAVERV